MLNTRYIALAISLVYSLFLPSAWAARTLVITVYPHDELAGISDQQLHDDFFQHWLDEMRSFTQHPIEVIFQRAIAGLTDIDYSAMSSNQILDAFTDEISVQRSARPFSFMNKDLLLTKDSYDRSGLNCVAGLAHVNGNTAIASMTTYGIPGHQLGHMLSAPTKMPGPTSTAGSAKPTCFPRASCCAQTATATASRTGRPLPTTSGTTQTDASPGPPADSSLRHSKRTLALRTSAQR